MKRAVKHFPKNCSVRKEGEREREREVCEPALGCRRCSGDRQRVSGGYVETVKPPDRRMMNHSLPFA